MSGNNADQNYDPFDPATLRIDHTSEQALGVERPLINVPVQKPSKQSFFRVHRSLDMRLDVCIITLESENETYLVTPQMAAKLPGETKAVRLLACIARHGGVFLWPLLLPPVSGRDSNWSITARSAAVLAETKWVRLQSNRASGSYDVTTSAHIPDPVWPDVEFRDLLKIAFGGDRIIDREDHPVILQLLGKC